VFVDKTALVVKHDVVDFRSEFCESSEGSRSAGDQPIQDPPPATMGNNCMLQYVLQCRRAHDCTAATEAPT
jgi:hypothetical protein